jgi:hypothetical protein
MPRGGFRVGAGRKKGSLSKRTTAIAEDLTATHQSPLEFLISIYTNPKISRQERMQAAIAACPYVHSKLSSMIPKEKISQIYVQEINVLAIPPGQYLSSDEIARLSALPSSVEGDTAVDALESPWAEAESEEAA